ncbi:hypothetical protein C8J57DRAFT_708763 [Mycena rebaudengoi]|nr:hypothetical protein C8J57DRAFT_708763 [Mycena rebaudengoi]
MSQTIFPEDDITVKSSRSDRMRSPPPLSRPHSSAAGSAPETSVVEQVPWTDMIPEVARLPDEFEESAGASHSTQEEVAANSVVEEPVESSSKAKDREPSRGRKPGKGKGKGKEKEKAPNSADSRTSSRLADTLTSVWGKDGSPSPTHDPGAAPEGNAEEHSALGEVTVEATVDAAPASPAVKVNEVRSVKATAPSTPKPEPAPLETPTAPESLAPVNDSAQEASEPAASRPRSPSASAADIVRQINPEEMPLPASPAESPTPDIQAEKSPAQSPAPELHPEESTAAPASEFLQVEAAANTAEGGGSKKVSPQPSPALHPKSLPGSSKQSPRVSPVPPERLLPTADVIVTPGVAAQCSSSPQMVLPELIALPLSAVGSPKSAVSPKLHASPLGIFENAVLPAELAGTGFLGSSSRPVSTAVSPRFNVIDVGDVTEGGSFVPARTPRQRSQACTPKQSQHASPLIKGAAIGNATAHSGDHTPTNREGEDLFGDTFWSHGEMEGGGDWSFIGRADLKDSKA